MHQLPTTYQKFLWHFIKSQPIGFLLLMIVALVSAISSTIWPYIISNFVDALDNFSGDKANVFRDLSELLTMALLFWLFVELMTRAKGVVIAFVMPKFEANIRMQTYKYVIQHSHSYFIKNYIGAIANRIADLPRGSSMVVDIAVGQFFSLGVAIIISAYLLLKVHYVLALVLCSWLGVHITVCWLFFKKAANFSQIQSEARSLVQGRIVDSISNHLSVRLFSRYKYEECHLAETQEDERNKYKAALIYVEKIKIMLGILSVLGVSALFFCVILFWQQSLISIGNVVFVANLTLNMMAMIWVASDEMTYFFREVGLCNQGLKIIQDPLNIKEEDSSADLILTKAAINFDSVTFRYKKTGYIFRNLSVNIKGGQTVGLVGLSGSGKTTFARLILRLYDVDAGSISIDGQDLRHLKINSLRDNIVLMPQDPILFHRSILENIRYGKIDATEKEVIEASKKAHCHEFIMELEDGYDTIVGEHGTTLSGGQRQRVAIARAILADASIVILDEATSALDGATEKSIQQSLKYLMNGRTSIIIAHKLSTLESVDRVLVFKEGKIVEQGTHTELLKLGGHYALLWSMQHDGVLPNELEGC